MGQTYTHSRLSNERRNSILMTCHCPDLGSASDWLKETRGQYGISALVTQTSFCEGSSGDLVKRRMFSQASSGLVYRQLIVKPVYPLEETLINDCLDI